MDDLCLHSALRGSVTGLGYIDDSTATLTANGRLMRKVRSADEAQIVVQQKTFSTPNALYNQQILGLTQHALDSGSGLPALEQTPLLQDRQNNY